MSQNEYTVIIIKSTSHAMRAEKALEQAGVKCKLIPVPRQFSSECGICIRVNCSHVEPTLQILKSVGVQATGIHEF